MPPLQFLWFYGQVCFKIYMKYYLNNYLIGCSNWCIPYQLKTLDQQVPQFKILSSDISCLDDQSCLIKWVIESDLDSPISRAEISYVKIDLSHIKILLYFYCA